MGGFARYPWPQWTYNAPYYFNKHWKVGVAFTFACTVFNFMWFNRYVSMHSMNAAGYSNYVDPEHTLAPSTVKIY